MNGGFALAVVCDPPSVERDHAALVISCRKTTLGFGVSGGSRPFGGSTTSDAWARGSSTLDSVRWSAQAAVPLASFFGRTHSVSHDGKRFLMTKPGGGQTSASFVVVENWLEELKRLVPTSASHVDRSPPARRVDFNRTGYTALSDECGDALPRLTHQPSSS